MTTLRLLADDLTGALDSAAPFSSWGPIQVAWAEEAFEPHRSLRALDSDTRDLSQALAQERVRAWLERDGQKGIAFKKIDSLLRGNTMAELDVCCRTERYATIVVAPAFPAQHRITTGGVQRARSSTDEPWREVGPCLATVLPGARAALLLCCCPAQAPAVSARPGPPHCHCPAQCLLPFQPQDVCPG